MLRNWSERIPSGSPEAGALVSGTPYVGLLGSEILAATASGDHGAGLFVPWTPEAGNRYRVLVTALTGGPLNLAEDGSGVADAPFSATLSVYENNLLIDDAITVTGVIEAVDLAINGCRHAHSAEAIALGTDSTITIADASHAHLADSLTMTISGDVTDLTIADASHGHAADAVTLSLASALTISDVLHGHAADEIALTSDAWLLIADTRHLHRVDNVALSIPGAFPDVLSAFHTYRVPGGAGSITFTVPGKPALTYRVE